MKNEKIVIAGALGTGFLASLCCVGPLVFAILGLGAFGAGAAFEKLRPLFAVLLAAFLAAGFYYTYRKREVACEDRTCRMESVGRGAKLLLWVVTIAALGLYLTPYFL